MSFESSSEAKSHTAAGHAGLTPSRLVAWLRDEGYRAKADLEGEGIHILTGLCGYAVNLWCIRVVGMDARCAQIVLDMKLKLGSSGPTEPLRRMLNDFNLTAIPAAVATVEPTGILVLRMSFLAEDVTTIQLFGRYFAAFEHLLQGFLRCIAAMNETRASEHHAPGLEAP